MSTTKILQGCFLGIIFCISFSLNGSEPRNDLEWILFSADRSANVGHLGIFYDPTYPIQNIEQGCRNLFDFRKNYSADIDYVVDTSVNKISYPENISEVARKHLLPLLTLTKQQNKNNMNRCGLVLYYTQNKPDNYINEIEQIRATGWPVVVMCHELQIAKDIDEAFFGDHNKSKSIVIRPKDPFYRNALLFAMFIVTATWLCHKYDLSSYFK